MNKNSTTIEDLARMINEGFKTTPTKEDMTALRSEMNQKFEAVESRLRRIENLLLEEQRRKIESLHIPSDFVVTS